MSGGIGRLLEGIRLLCCKDWLRRVESVCVDVGETGIKGGFGTGTKGVGRTFYSWIATAPSSLIPFILSLPIAKYR